MEAIGVIRKTDRLGRIVIPIEIREFFHIESHDPVEILPTENGIFIRKPGYEVRKITE